MLHSKGPDAVFLAKIKLIKLISHSHMYLIRLNKYGSVICFT